MNIAVIGGGNIGTALTAEFSRKNHDVILYTSKAHDFGEKLLVQEDDCQYESGDFRVTNDLQKALEDRELIIITIPANAVGNVAESMLEYVKAGMKILFLPGLGGMEFIFSEHIKKGAALLGLQRVPAVYRVIEPGKSVRVSGRRKEGLHLGTIPAKDAGRYAKEIEELFGMKCTALPNYLCVTLTPSNPILHTSRLYGLFKDYREGTFYERNILFYQEWDEFSSDILFKCDSELQNIIKELHELELSSVKSLKLHYESETTEALTKKITSIPSFAGLTSPMVEIAENKWVPDWNSRYFKADFPYGLAIIRGLAEIIDVDVPNIDKVLEWYSKVTNQEYYENGQFSGKDLCNTGIPQCYGYQSREDLLSIYK